MPTNVITNGDFSAGSTGWTPLYGGITISGGQCNSSGGIQILTQNVPFTTGQVYNFHFDYTMTAGARLRVTNGNVNQQNVVWTSNSLGPSGTLQGSFTAVGPYFSIEADGAIFTGTIDNIFASIPTPNAPQASQMAILGVEAIASDLQVSQLALLGVISGPPNSYSLGPAFKLPCWQPCTAFGTEALVINFK
jgi:hypothetical protein